MKDVFIKVQYLVEKIFYFWKKGYIHGIPIYVWITAINSDKVVKSATRFRL